MKLIKNILLIIILFLFQNGISQQACRNSLDEAGMYFEQGLFTEIPGLLAPCMSDGFTRAQKIEAYKLIILAYLFDDDAYAAERTMNEFLKKYPEYEVMPKDPVEFVYLLESYKTSAIFSINVLFGPTINFPQTVESYSIIDRSSLAEKSQLGAGFFAGIGISYEINSSLSLHLESFYETHNYTFLKENKVYAIDQTGETSNIENQSFKITFEENIKKINIPLSLTYKFGSGDITYFGRLGMDVSFLNIASGTPSRYHNSNTPDLTENNVDIYEQRTKYFYSGIIGGGVRLKVPRGFISLDTRLNLGIFNFNVPEKRYDNELLLTRYGYIDNDFRLNYMTIGIGYNFSLYRSKKK